MVKKRIKNFAIDPQPFHLKMDAGSNTLFGGFAASGTDSDTDTTGQSGEN
jgi:hypothetical protein